MASQSFGGSYFLAIIETVEFYLLYVSQLRVAHALIYTKKSTVEVSRKVESLQRRERNAYDIEVTNSAKQKTTLAIKPLDTPWYDRFELQSRITIVWLKGFFVYDLSFLKYN